MRKPLVALSLALGVSLGVTTVAASYAAAPTAKNPIKYIPPAPPAPPTFTPTRTAPAKSPSNAVSGAQIVQFALKYLGYPYTATGNSPATGFSCIGFASYVYRSLGISLPGDLQDALNYAPQVPFSQLQPGDLIYFHDTLASMPYLSHVAIYMGGGRFVHAEYYGYGVRISSFNNDSKDYNYWIGHYMTANRPWAGASVSPIITAPGLSAPAQPSVRTTTQVTAVSGDKHSAVTVNSLNLRTSPDKNSSVVTVALRGTDVAIIGRSNGWYQVQLPNGMTGWVVAYGIGLAHTATVPTTTTADKVSSGLPTQPVRTGYPVAAQHHRMTAIHVSGLRVHSGPSLDAPVVTSLAAGQRVQVLSRGNGWTKVRLSGGQVGYVSSAYTSPSRNTKTAAAPAAVAAPVSSPNKVSYRATTSTATRVFARTTTRTTTRITARTSRRYAQRGTQLTGGVRVHTAPGLKSPVVGTAIAGTHVTVLSHRGHWVLVRLPSGQTGYVYSAYVRG